MKLPICLLVLVLWMDRDRRVKVSGQTLDVLKLETAGAALCAPQQIARDPAAAVSGPVEAVRLDATSVAVFGPRAEVQLEAEVEARLNVQSGLRVLGRGSARFGRGARVALGESSHVTVTRKLRLEPQTKLTLDASRVLAAGTLKLQEASEVELFDMSKIRSYEGGSVYVGPRSRLEMYRGASLTASDWQRHTEPGDQYISRTSFGDRSRVMLLDSSHLHASFNSELHTGPLSNVELRPGSTLRVEAGTFNVSEGGALTLGQRSQLTVGSAARSEASRGPRSASLVYGAAGLTLKLADGVALTVGAGQHCKLVENADLAADLTIADPAAAGASPAFRCFASYEELTAPQA